MNIFTPLLAQSLIPNDVIPGGWHWMGLTLKELLILLGAVALVTSMLLVWAVYFRKRPRAHSHHHHHHHSHNQTNSSDSTNQSNGEEGGQRRYRRKRRRRRDHRPRNPTLAETGGLPPLRSEHPQDPLP